jgi:hypothetical protein
MTEPSGRDVVAENQSSLASEPVTRAIPAALWTAFAGHLIAMIAAVTDAVRPTTTVAAAIACSIVAVAALTELARDVHARRAVTALIGGHVVAAAILFAGVVPGTPWRLPLAGLAAAAALGVACLMAFRRAPTVNRQPRSLAVAPRVASIALVVQALVLHWSASTTGLSMPLRAAIFLATTALGVALLASLSIIALRLRPRWVIAGLLAWTVGWIANTADTGSLIHWSLGGPFPMGADPLLQLDADLVQVVATAGGLAIGAALVAAIRDARARHSAVVLLAGYVTFGLIGASTEYQIGLATDFPAIAALRKHRSLADAITALTFAGVLWLYWRRVAAKLPRAAIWERDT